MVNVPAIIGIGSATPPTVTQTALWDGFFKNHFGNDAMARRLFKSVGVEQRHAVISPLVEDATGWTTEKRMQRYLPEALPLAVEATRDALANSGVSPNDIGQLTVVSCTGYASPGLDAFVPQQLGMNTDVQRSVIGHMGCYAALPGLAGVADFVTARQKPAVLLSVELSSLHVQPPTNDHEQMVAHALFSDAAVALVVAPDSDQTSGFEVVDVASALYVDSSDLMTWRVTDLGFRMGLSARIPDVLALNVRALVERLLSPHYLAIDAVSAWAVHPGGPRILDVVEEQLKLGSDQLVESRSVLAEHGNCSSATVLLVLDEIRKRDVPKGEFVVALGFGPGLTLYAMLLRAV